MAIAPHSIALKPKNCCPTAVQLLSNWQEPSMTRIDRRLLERKLEQTRRLALEPTDPVTQERLAQMIEELEVRLRDMRKVA